MAASAGRSSLPARSLRGPSCGNRQIQRQQVAVRAELSHIALVTRKTLAIRACETFAAARPCGPGPRLEPYNW